MDQFIYKGCKCSINIIRNLERLRKRQLKLGIVRCGIKVAQKRIDLSPEFKGICCRRVYSHQPLPHKWEEALGMVVMLSKPR